MSDQGSAPVTVQWALWGKQAQGVGYRVLACSAGVVSKESFDEVVTRYSPGTVETLPQVTIGWLRGTRPGGDQIALVIHDQYAWPDSGDHTVLARLFCTQYHQLATASAGYLSMYERFSVIDPWAVNRDPIAVSGLSPAATPDADDQLARRTAALLLTTKPVCILGADRVDLAGRLRFIDTVASLLPYGLRSRLSAATWVSSTFGRHRFRLFFADAQRHPGDPDRVVVWGTSDEQPIGNDTADRYLSLLTDGTLGADRLAAHTDQTDFSSASIGGMLERLSASGGGRKTSPGPERVETGDRSGPASDATIGMLLRSLARGLAGETSAMASEINQMRRHLTAQLTPAQRDDYADLIRRLKLFRPDPPVDEQLLTQLYDVLLRLAFTAPLSYADYCRAEECSGNSPVHRPLLRAMRQFGLAPAPELLVLSGLGGREWQIALQRVKAAPTTVVSIAADPALRPQHVKIIAEIIARPLSGLLGYSDRRLLKTSLSQVGFLSEALRRHFADDPKTELGLLAGLLRAACGRRFSRADIREILSSSDGAPSPALFAALVRLIEPRDVPVAAGQFAAGHLDTSAIGDQAREEVQALLHRHCG